MNACLNCGWDTGEGNPPNPSHCGHCPPWLCEDCGEMDAPPPSSCSCWTVLNGMSLADIKATFARADLSVVVRS